MSKTFGPVRANADVSFAVAAGSIHGLVGENGAGKSTLMHLLYGVHRPDAGRIRLWGAPVQLRGPEDAIALGVGMVHQHFSLVPCLTVLENIVLGREPGRPWRIDWAQARRQVHELTARHHMNLPLELPVETLDVAAQQRVEILKALYRGARILILDEPTTVLAPEEYQRLLTSLRMFVQCGGTVLYISHRLPEILELCETVTVLRAGRVVVHGSTAEQTAESLAQAMLGEDLSRSPAPPHIRVRRQAAPTIELRDVCTPATPADAGLDRISLGVHPAEILGIAGVAGNGQRSLVHVLAGVISPSSGHVFWKGAISWDRVSSRRRRAAGICWIPADRSSEGLIANQSVADNLVLGHHRRSPYARFGMRRRGIVRGSATEALWHFRIQPPDPELPVGQLSGGNQQKVLVARELAAAPRLLIAEYPTRGVDVRTAETVLAALHELREAGGAIVLVSADVDELLAVCDRIAVMYRGRIVGVVAGETATRAQLAPLFGGMGEAGAGAPAS